MSILKDLNEEQKQALLSINGANLVSAGAGTGKTKLLTYRIAYLIDELKVDPFNILAITFTNKAANEMKTRVESLTLQGNRVWISTFHSMCVKILRKDIQNLDSNYDKYFTIYSDTDSEKLLKSILKEFGIEEEVKKYSTHISNCKNKNMSIYMYEKEYAYLPDIANVVRVFIEYENRLKQSNALDFDDLLVKTYDLFLKCPDILQFYAQRFEYVLVDEFQDTNKIQYDLTKMLASYHKNLFVVGDEDQSIYSWRGADFTNIFNISKDFQDTKIFKLQQNYRCTQDILDKANTLIALNDDRFDKKLWTQKASSDKVSYKKYYDEQEEADSVASKIYSLVNSGKYSYKDIAILIRLNALSLQFEEKLLSYNIPHKIYGGFKFFERAEIKNILSYLRLFINEKDEVSLLRIINFPKRAIGDGAILSLKQLASQNNMGLLETILNIENIPEAKKLVPKFKVFKDTFLSLKQDYINLNLDDFCERVIDKFEIKNAYPNINEENTDKLLNIDQFIGSVKTFIQNNPNCDLNDYLESVTLQSDIDTLGEGDTVTVSTIHAVKGLEFKVVFVVGMEDGVFPLSRCKENPKDLQEERRLAYVAFTRAEEQLYVSSCKTRYMYGRRNYQMESPFVIEAKLKDQKSFEGFSNFGSYQKSGYTQDLKSAIFNSKVESQTSSKYETYIPKPNQTISWKSNQDTSDQKTFEVGEIVGHPKFGVGTVLNIDILGKTIDINFGALGKKTLMLDIAPLKSIKKP